MENGDNFSLFPVMWALIWQPWLFKSRGGWLDNYISQTLQTLGCISLHPTDLCKFRFLRCSESWSSAVEGTLIPQSIHSGDVWKEKEIDRLRQKHSWVLQPFLHLLLPVCQSSSSGISLTSFWLTYLKKPFLLCLLPISSQARSHPYPTGQCSYTLAWTPVQQAIWVL